MKDRRKVIKTLGSIAGRIWVKGKGEKVVSPETGHKIPDTVLDISLRQVTKKIKR